MCYMYYSHSAFYKINVSYSIHALCFAWLQYAMLVPAAVLFAFGVVVFFCLIPSPDQIGKSNKKRLHVQHSCPMSILIVILLERKNMLKYTKCYFLDSELSLICSVFFRIVNASINNARERKIVTLNIIIVSRPVRTVAVIFFGCSRRQLWSFNSVVKK